VVITIADQGGGINPLLLPSLFQFGVSTKGEGGNGMGLWVVKQLVDRHGGTIELQSKVGEGTHFTVIWPREFPALAAVPEPAAVSTRKVPVQI
jgi:two-component system sensor histidine kinase DctS